MIVGLIAVLGVGACVSEAPATDGVNTEAIVVTDARGVEIQLDSVPERIISMAPSNTEMIYAIGAGAQLVGRDDVSDYPPDVLEIPSIGSTYGELNTEAILELNPDIVLAADLTAPEQIEALENLGLTVYQVRNPNDFSDLYAVFLELGVLTGNTEEAEGLVDLLRERVDRVLSAVADAEPKPVFYEVDGSDPAAPWTTGASTFQDVLLDAAGGENIAADLDGWGQLSVEDIVVRDPQVIFFATGPWVPTTVESLSGRAGWSNISAVVEGDVFAIDTDWVDRPGPRLVDALETMASALHPELFE